jgi:hypothetical protein
VSYRTPPPPFLSHRAAIKRAVSDLIKFFPVGTHSFIINSRSKLPHPTWTSYPPRLVRAHRNHVGEPPLTLATVRCRLKHFCSNQRTSSHLMFLPLYYKTTVICRCPPKRRRRQERPPHQPPSPPPRCLASSVRTQSITLPSTMPSARSSSCRKPQSTGATGKPPPAMLPHVVGAR